MRYLLVIAAFTALAIAKPEFYKEKEDFQYSRSSTDEGSKSGFYGAQRGNMGGNYEKAHNMDGLAQNQMSGLVRNVEGELGDGYKLRTGSVYSSANSRGIYGSGHYDLSNLQGRNFDETESFDNSHSSTMSQSSAFGNSRLNGRAYGSSNRAHSSGYRGYQASDQSQQYMQTDNLQSADHLQSAHGYGYGSEAAQLSTSGFQSHHDYDLSASNLDRTGAYGSNMRSRILTTAPVRVIVRPGIRRTVPLTAQVYDADHSDTSFTHENSNINRETELLNTDGQQVHYRTSNAPKRYESSYSYHKEWEKHNTQPINVPGAVPTVNPFAVQSETRGDLNEERNSENIQHQSNMNAYNSLASNTAFTANTQSSREARYQAGYNMKHSSSSSLAENTNGYNTGRRSASQTGSSLVASNANEYNTGSSSSLLASNANGYKTGSTSSLLTANTNGYNKVSHGTNSEEGIANAADSGNLVQSLSTKPKSYHSSYSYHKSWERQGDPYIIKPAGSGAFDGQASQKLTTASASQGEYSSRHYGSQYKQAHHSFSQNGFDSDCDEEGHARVARSADSRYKPENQAYQNMYHGQEEYGQQTQSRLENLEDFGQQTQNQWDNLQNFGQQEQSNWENSQNLGQQIQSQWDNLQDLGQQPQNQWDNLQNLGQQTEEKFDKLEDLGQQPQSQWDNIVSQEIEQKFDTLHTMGQQTQNQWDNMPEIGQMTQGKLDKLENFGQQTQTQWDKIENFEQQSQNKLDKAEDLGQQQQVTRGSTEQQNRSWQKLEDFNQHSQSDVEQQIQEQDEQTPKMVFYNKEFGQRQNVFDLNDTQDSQLTDKKHDSGSNLSQKEDKDLIRGPWNNLMLNLGAIQQETSNFDLNNHNPTHTSNKNNDRPDEAQNPELYEFDSPKIFHSQQTQNTWNIKEEDTIQQRPFEQNENLGLNNVDWHNANNLQRQTEKSAHSTTEKNSHPLGGQWHKTDGDSVEPDKEFHSQDEQNSSLLGGLWDKIDGIAKETLKDIDEDEEDTQKSNKVDSTDWSQEIKPSATRNTPEPLKPQINTNLSKPNVTPNQDKISRPKDVGRGDIGPEDTDLTSDTSVINKPYKTPNEIDALSLTRHLNVQPADSNSDKNKFNVLSDKELKIVQDLIKKIENEDSDEVVITSTSTPLSPIPTIATNIDKNILADLNENEEKLVQAINNKFIFNQNKKRTSTPFTPRREIYDQQSRNKEEFGHNTNTLPMYHRSDNYYTNVPKHLDQKNEDYEPEEQQNLEQHVEDFQQTQDLQNPSQLENFVQQQQSDWNSENNLAQVLDQQLLYLGEVSQKFDEKQINEEIKEIEATHQTKMNDLTPTEPEPDAQKHGFWKSVGNKLTNAKKKVMSWFS